MLLLKKQMSQFTFRNALDSFSVNSKKKIISLISVKVLFYAWYTPEHMLNEMLLKNGDTALMFVKQIFSWYKSKIWS